MTEYSRFIKHPGDKGIVNIHFDFFIEFIIFNYYFDKYLGLDIYTFVIIRKKIDLTTRWVYGKSVKQNIQNP